MGGVKGIGARDGRQALTRDKLAAEAGHRFVLKARLVRERVGYGRGDAHQLLRARPHHVHRHEPAAVQLEPARVAAVAATAAAQGPRSAGAAVDHVLRVRESHLDLHGRAAAPQNRTKAATADAHVAK